MKFFRYVGKKSPDRILAEICWWYKNVFETTELEEGEPEEIGGGGEAMEVEEEDDDNDVVVPYDDYGDVDEDGDTEYEHDEAPAQKRSRN